MLKKVPVSDVRLGMFIEKLDGNWLKHPFWKTSFRLSSKKDLDTLLDSAISHVWIDIEQGDDVQPSQPVETVSSTEPAKKEQRPPVISLQDELNTARETLARAKQSTQEMFQQARMGQSIKTEDLAPLVDEISESLSRNSAAMLTLTRMKTSDDYTYLHSVAVCALMIALARQLNYEGDMQALGTAGLLHDIGKVAMPEEVLNKPGKLTDEEYQIMKTHPRRGWEILRDSFKADEIALDVCLHHHERVDGKGYPEQLSGDNLSLIARMGAVCDVYDAITSERCYKPGWDPAEALKKMAEWQQQGQFDKTVFNAFVKTVGIYPTGTLLKLKSGRLGIVTEQSEQTLLKPRIKVFYSTTSKSPIPQKIIELTRSQEVIESIETPESWGFDRQRIMDILSA